MTYPLVLFLIAIWLLAAWWSARVAAKRGRSPSLGAAIGLALPVVGLAVAWAIPRDEEAVAHRERTADRAEQVEEVRRCWRSATDASATA